MGNSKNSSGWLTLAVYRLRIWRSSLAETAAIGGFRRQQSSVAVPHLQRVVRLQQRRLTLTPGHLPDAHRHRHLAPVLHRPAGHGRRVNGVVEPHLGRVVDGALDGARRRGGRAGCCRGGRQPPRRLRTRPRARGRRRRRSGVH